MDFKSKKFLVLTKIVVDFETCVLTAAVVQSSNSSFIFALFRLFFFFTKWVLLRNAHEMMMIRMLALLYQRYSPPLPSCAGSF